MENKAVKSKLWSREFIFLLVIVFTAAINYNIFISVFPLYVLGSGGNNVDVGNMSTVLTLSYSITMFFVGPLLDRFGRKKILIIGSILFTISTVGFAVFTDITSMYILRLINGISQGLYFLASGTFVADVLPEDRMVEGIGIYSISNYFASAFAPMLGIFIYNSYGGATVFVTAAIASGLGMFLCFIIKQKYTGSKGVSSNGTGRHISIRTFIEPAVFLPSLIMFILFIGNSSVSSFITAFGKERSIENISLYFTFLSIFTILTRLFSGKLVSKFGISHLIAAGIFICSISYLIIAFSYSIPLIIVSAILCGFGFGICFPLISATIYRMVSPDRKGVANSTFSLVGNLGSALGAAIWGMISQSSGYTLVYIFSAVAALLAVVLHMTAFDPQFKSGKISSR
jgi:MFS family permease